ncbi:hypothetical protein AAFN86_16610 [Roseomonas sp. CAU 1739]|uniref:hypothetical protein n=1 Tax=Roseomonas sp. CAU 1739 TaxID=3140364 RepID=UPI00325BE4B4
MSDAQQFTGMLKPGDIMVKYNDHSAINSIIAFGQFFGRGSSQFTHAGLCASPTHIIEMDGDGLQLHDLTAENSHYSYRVYRCVIDGVGAGAAAAGEMMLAAFQAGATNLTYSLGQAAASVWKSSAVPNGDIANDMLEKLLAGGDAFFCSGHVVLCYQMACSQLTGQQNFPFSDAGGLFSLEQTCYQPAFLERKLSESTDFFWKRGEFTGASWTGP